MFPFRRICLALLLYASALVNAQDKEALIIIDIQDFYFPGGDMALSEPEAAAENAALLLEKFREKNDLIIHVRHNYEPGGTINERITPLDDESIIRKDQVNAFLGTGLDSILRANEINTLVLCGMQTHMCLEAATRAGADLGYTCIVISDACATRDLTFGGRTVVAEDVQASTLAGLRSYAKILSAREYRDTNPQ